MHEFILAAVWVIMNSCTGWLLFPQCVHEFILAAVWVIMKSCTGWLLSVLSAALVPMPAVALYALANNYYTMVCFVRHAVAGLACNQ